MTGHRSGDMPIGQWSESVQVLAGRGGTTRFAVHDVEQAAEILLKQWPKHATPGPAHLEARESILACLMGKCDPEVARQAFIAAAQEGGILAKFKTGPI